MQLRPTLDLRALLSEDSAYVPWTCNFANASFSDSNITRSNMLQHHHDTGMTPTTPVTEKEHAKELWRNHHVYLHLVSIAAAALDLADRKVGFRGSWAQEATNWG